jgi:5-formyltetrahydrofolate cyclo-ligase
MHISQQKEQLRRSINERIDRMTKSDRDAEGRTVSRIALSNIPKGSKVAAYFPLTKEANIQPLLLDLLKRGDSVYLPRFEDNKMVVRQLENFDTLSPGAFTIPEPPVTAPLGEELDIVLVPGRAFDTRGARLGRGSGGYDKWIRKQRKANPQAKFYGVCLECQLVREVPTEAHDEQMDAIITARGFMTCRSQEPGKQEPSS